MFKGHIAPISPRYRPMLTPVKWELIVGYRPDIAPPFMAREWSK